MADDLLDFSIQWDGIEEIMANLDKATDEVIKAIEEGVSENAGHLLEKAKALAPLLTGDLEAAGHLGKLINNGKEIKQRVIFSGVPYALRRHEEAPRMGTYPQYDQEGRRIGEYIDGRGVFTRGKPPVDGMEPGRKYLERPLKFYSKKYMQTIANKVKEVLNK
ncbi:hypothetical protein DXT63_08465 [Thermoanaerobacteraceae bacterium SP2]|nr:hypothetical protein DXT63_08465 [Thermoanaerobacteraceae bacterium SP2]